MFKCYARHTRRYVSTSITINTLDKRLAPVNGKFRVPLMKSPTHFGHSTQRVNRLYNEDKLSACVLDIYDNNNELHKVFNFNIFDGHGGDQCSNFLQTHLAQHIEDYNPETSEELLKQYALNVGGYWKRWYRSRKDNMKSLQKVGIIDDLQNVPLNEIDLKSRLTFSFLDTDMDFMQQDDNKSGSTCTLALLNTVYSNSDRETYYFDDGTINLLTVGHVGDTKAILVDRTGVAHALTIPHHPSNPREAARLRKYATNFMTDSFGEERFISLANTRAFGDINFKEQGVSAEPEITQVVVGDAAVVRQQLTPDEIGKYTVGGLGGDESFLVLCSDGVTGILTDQEIADIVMTTYNNKGQATPQQGADEILKFVEYVGGEDNATVLVVRLNGWGKWGLEDRTGELRAARMDDFNPRSSRG